MASHCSWDKDTNPKDGLHGPGGSGSCLPFSLGLYSSHSHSLPTTTQTYFLISWSCQTLWHCRALATCFSLHPEMSPPHRLHRVNTYASFSSRITFREFFPTKTLPLPFAVHSHRTFFFSFIAHTWVLNCPFTFWGWCCENCVTKCPSPPLYSKPPQVALKSHNVSWPTRLDLAA